MILLKKICEANRMDTNKETKTIDELFLNSLKGYLERSEQLDIKMIYTIFPEMNRKTISWRLYKLVQQGKLYKAGRGYYSLNRVDEHSAAGYNYLQKVAREIYETVMEFGYDFYITGLDALVGEIHHIPEQFPTIMIVEKNGMDEIKEALNNKGYFVLSEREKDYLQNVTFRNKVQVILLKGKNFSFAMDNIANKEKAFVDLFYAVTRLDYALSVKELIRIYESMERNKSIATLVMKKAARDRGIATEIDWILDLNKMTQKAKEFFEYQLSLGRNNELYK